MPHSAPEDSGDRTCPVCAKSLSTDSSVCPDCGASVSGLDRSGDRVRARLDFLDPGDPTPTPTVSRKVLEVAADPESTHMSRWTLRFASPVLERAFRAEYRHVTLRNGPLAAGLALALIVSFGLLDAIIQPTVLRELWLIRYGIFAPCFALVLGACYVSALRPYVERGLAVSVLVAGGSILAMILISPPPGRYFYYAGLILVILYNYTLTRLRFAIMNALAWAIVAAYLAGELVAGQMPWQILVNNMFFFVAASVIGMFAAYFTESLARQNFLQDKLVRRAREFGSYRLDGRLREGGMGEVWRARHRLLARPAAIKLIRAEVIGNKEGRARRRIVQRFEREAQATALLRSAHTIELYDFGMSEDGTFYYVMELLEGYDLHTLVQRFGPLPPHRAILLLRQACDSLAEAHDNGLIHRDVKPANIFVCRYGRKVDFVKVMDFGVAAWTGTESEGVTEGTIDRFAGTPSSMAPEQIHGEGAVDGRTDLYGLGCVAYWLLAGRPVFEGGNDLHIMAQHLRTPPDPPSAHAAGPIPDDLEALVLWCLEKDPARRPQSADELDARLAACRTVTEWTERDAREWWTANPPAVEPATPAAERSVMPTVVRG